jgi:hypothetical protein
MIDLAHAESHPSDMIFVVTRGDYVSREALFGVASTFSDWNEPGRRRTDGDITTLPRVYWNLGGTLVELYVAVGTGTAGTGDRFEGRATEGLHVVELRIPDDAAARARYTGAMKIFTHFYL